MGYEYLVMLILSARLHFGSQPVYDGGMGRVGALLEVLARPGVRNISAAALLALGTQATRKAVWRFAQDCMYQHVTNALLGFQLDRLTPAWLEQHVSIAGALPEDGCVLVSIHQYHQRLSFGRLSIALRQLGTVGIFEPLSSTDPSLLRFDRLASNASRLRGQSRFMHRVFGPRLYRPGFASRQGLEVLARGGGLVVLADYAPYAPLQRAPILGRMASFTDGAVWFARRSGKPIVPFLLEPAGGGHWQLCCGDPVAPTRAAVLSVVEALIRRQPTSWVGWANWFDSPPIAEGNVDAPAPH